MTRITVTRDIESPPEGWKFTVAETGVVVTAPYFKILKSRVRAHLVANNLPVADDFDSWLADAACKENSLGAPFCGQEVAKPVGIMPYLTFGVAARFIKTVIGAVRDRKFVSREEAERRVAVCMACPYAGSIAGCKGCSSIFKEMERALADSPVNVEEGKEHCLACGCLIRAKVLLDNGTLDRAEAGSESVPYHESCWRLR